MVTSVSSSEYKASASVGGANSGKSIFRIVGIACICGFVLDMLILSAPPRPMDLQWRIGFLQQLGDRSIVFMLGVALFMLGAVSARSVLKPLALGSMTVGLIFCLMVPLSIRDSVTLQKQLSSRITSQASQIESQIQQAQAKGKTQPSEDQIKQALAQLSTQSAALQKQATQSAIKTAAASVSNLLITGLALIGLGRYGLRRR